MSAQPEPSGWPLGAPDASGRLDYSRGEVCITEALWNLLWTSPGERLMRPTFGAGLRDYLDQPNTESTRQLMASAVRQAITLWEPRVTLSSVTVDADPATPVRAVVSVAYTVRGVPPSAAALLTLSLNMAGT